ncbi:MAG TPA: thioredoxin domain-containing protein [Ignavibacteriaceae bacterium]
MSIANKLVNEQSPYLLQHAYNPVDWYPWSEEAFEKARIENKPIFLSIGYSTCHWCHVMEKESFEDEEVAKLMNEAFVSIKVDREERPDIDGIYMTVCQILTGSGGWPLTIVMTPEKKPFFAGTYFPKLGRYGRAGMMELILQLSELWNSKNDDILKSAEEISHALINSSKFSGDEILSSEILDQAFNELSRRFDPENGGFGKSPKFPTPHNLTFLLRYWSKNKNEYALFMVEKTLKEMRLGGIYDHIGFGFHRYSTDPQWLVPHFEKMLYDQALLAIAYIEAYQATKKELFENTVKEILEYVNRDMCSKKGGFYSAEDADSEGEEGKYYLWTVDEVRAILKDDADLFLEIFNCEPAGNWIDPMHGGKVGTNILHLQTTMDEYSSKSNVSTGILEIKIALAQKQLLEAREKRIHPHKDDKILTDWNGLMISAFAKAAQVFDEKKYIEIAESTAKFILNHMTLQNGRLLHRYRNGNADIAGNLDDHAFLIAALLDLYETTFSVDHLIDALKLNDDLIKYFWDENDGAFFFTATDSEKLLVRQKEIYDGAIPSGNSIALLNLVRLYRFTGRTEFEVKASQMIKTFSQLIKTSPSAYTQFLSALDFYIGPSKEILLVGNDDEKVKRFLRILREIFIPNKVIIYKDDRTEDKLSKAAEFTKSYQSLNGAEAYICENFSCRLPVTSEKDLIALLSFK